MQSLSWLVRTLVFTIVVVIASLSAPTRGEAQCAIGSACGSVALPTLASGLTATVSVSTEYSASGTLTCQGDGTVVTACTIVSNGGGGCSGSFCGLAYTATVGYALGAASGIGTLTFTIPTSLNGPGGSSQLTVNAVGQPQISILAAAGAVSVAPNASGTTTFTVTNRGAASDSVVLSSICSGTAIASGSCGNPSPANIRLAAGASSSASVAYTASATGGATGMVKLAATVVAQGGIGSSVQPDTGWTDVTVTAPASTGLAIAGVSAFPTIDRGVCLEIQLAPSITSECGDARVVHPLQTIRTYNKARTPVLLYSWAHAWPFLMFPAHLTMASTGSLPDTVHGHTYFRPSGTTQSFANSVDGLSTWLGSQWTDGSTRQIVMPGSMVSDSTGLYDYRIVTTRIYNADSTTLQDTVQGQFILVNRESSYFGAGWWLAGLERLIVYGSGLSAKYAWIGGDGSTQLYTACGGTSTTYACPSRYVTSRDSIQILGGSAGYVRWATHGVRVWFNAAGLHDSTTDRLQHTTEFYYDANNRLTSIAVPTPNGPLTAYTFSYGTDGVVSQIKAPPPSGNGAGRTIKLSSAANSGSGSPTPNVLTTIYDADGDSTKFTYDGTSLGRMTSERDRRGTVTTLAWDGAALLDSVSIAMGSGKPSIVRTLSNGQGQGLGVSWVADAAVAIPDSAYTTYTGPRAHAGGDSSDVTRFWLDSLNQVARIRDAHGYWSVLARTDTSYIGVVTRL